MSIIKKFDEFVNEMLLNKKNSDNYGKTNILSDLINEFTKKYYSIDREKLGVTRQKEYFNLIKEQPGLEEFIDYLYDNEDDFTIGIYFYANEDERGYVDYGVDDLDDGDYEKCIKTIKSYTDKNMVNKMLDIIEDVIYNNVDLSEVIEYADERYEDQYSRYEDYLEDRRMEDRLKK